MFVRCFQNSFLLKPRLFYHSKPAQTSVIPFNRKSPELIAKYIRFRNEGIKKYRTKSQLDELMELNYKQILENIQKVDNTPQRLSKHLSNLGLFSRHHAEEIIRSGIFYVDSKKIVDPTLMINQNTNLSIYFPTKFDIPIPNNIKLWLYHKPMGSLMQKIEFDVFFYKS